MFQETSNSAPCVGDQLLAKDLSLYVPESSSKVKFYLTYPSSQVPRFIVPLGDIYALKFLIGMLSADKGVSGSVLRLFLKIPFVPTLLARWFAERVIINPKEKASGSVSFTDKVRLLIYEHRDTFKRQVGQIRVTKFCQRIAGPGTKILFLITDEFGVLCIVKVMRGVVHNERLKREAFAQRILREKGGISVPGIYFEGEIDGLYVYAEEVVSGVNLTKRLAKRKVREIINIVNNFPVCGTISSQNVAEVLAALSPEHETAYASAVVRLESSGVEFKMGLTHSDLGRPNILYDGNRIHIIDWGSAGERPFYLIDAVYLLIRLYDIRSLNEWHMYGLPVFLSCSDVSRDEADALYDVWTATEVLYKKYPAQYALFVNKFMLTL